MIAQAQDQGLALTGPDGLLKQMTKTVLEAVLNAEMTEHLGHEKHQAEPSRASTNVRNGTRSKTVVSDAVGEVEIAVPRDRAGSFEPVIVKSGSVGWASSGTEASPAQSCWCRWLRSI
jgi:transposase-like protein